jgi:hypothetical protein
MGNIRPLTWPIWYAVTCTGKGKCTGGRRREAGIGFKEELAEGDGDSVKWQWATYAIREARGPKFGGGRISPHQFGGGNWVHHGNLGFWGSGMGWGLGAALQCTKHKTQNAVAVGLSRWQL